MLPTKKIKGDNDNPGLTLLYSPPKCGKTTLLSKLDDCLILDFENGSRYVDALKINIIGLSKPKETPEKEKERTEKGEFYLEEVGKEIIKNKKPYKYIAIDTVTKLEELLLPEAAELYRASPMGKNWEGTDVLSLANGAGYKYLRDAYNIWINKIRKLADHIILVGHLKEKIVDKKGTEVSAKDIDLTGKLKMIACQAADAVGYLYRGKNSELIINFKSSEEITCGARPNHLKGKEIVIAEYDPISNDLTNVNWKLVFPN